MLTRILDHRPRDGQHPTIPRQRDARWHRRGALQLGGKEITKSALEAVAHSEISYAHRFKDQFAQQRSYVKHDTR
jgi:hypothetical protein